MDKRECMHAMLNFCPEDDLFSNITERGRYVSNDAPVHQAFLQILDIPPTWDSCPEGDLFSNITERGQYVSNDAPARQGFREILDAPTLEQCHWGTCHKELPKQRPSQAPQDTTSHLIRNELFESDISLTATFTGNTELYGSGVPTLPFDFNQAVFDPLFWDPNTFVFDTHSANDMSTPIPLYFANDVLQSPQCIDSPFNNGEQVYDSAHPPTNQPQSQRFHCDADGCTRHYKRKHELKRHQKDHAETKAYQCRVPFCNRSGENGFARSDHLRQHMRKVHGMKLRRN
ncbi:uncharacterized protein LY89DRAFT_735459 [Mollisia scopiformis]|uniref:C2H2-type domain-containing protein n=1 Tax=Mollisia scopiformis TaxID=149040 RepID=A0A194X6A2_MOLSC|nr:uncharacterized protein LY89DRAFT_735459 [Mollisia scopiformis]KUJ15337.1 hypothetical protein LY89DRAFT_735459 [Mollisia scopiformis]